MATDFASLGRNQKASLIAGGLALILSFFTSYITVSIAGFSAGTSAWHSYATLGILLVIVATAIVAVQAFSAGTLPEGIPWSLAAFAASALGAFLIVLRAVTVSSAHPGWSGYLLFIAAISLGFFTFQLFRSSGEQVPEMGKHRPTT